MSLFDLLFIVLFLTAVALLLGAAVAALTGRGDRALRTLRRLGVGVIVYMAVVAGVSLLSSRRVVGKGADQCSDDWCIAVLDATPTPGAAGVTYRVRFRISSRARRVTQRERFVVVYLRDHDGRRFDPGPSDGQAPFDASLSPGESVVTTRTFNLPPSATGLGVVVSREGGLPFPGCCIIGEGLFHKAPIVPVD